MISYSKRLKSVSLQKRPVLLLQLAVCLMPLCLFITKLARCRRTYTLAGLHIARIYTKTAPVSIVPRDAGGPHPSTVSWRRRTRSAQDGRTRFLYYAMDL